MRGCCFLWARYPYSTQVLDSPSGAHRCWTLSGQYASSGLSQELDWEQVMRGTSKGWSLKGRRRCRLSDVLPLAKWSLFRSHWAWHQIQYTNLSFNVHFGEQVVWPDPDLDGREAYNKSPPSREVGLRPKLHILYIMFVNIYIFIHTHTHTHIYISIYICIYIYIYMYIYVSIYLSIYIYICVSIYMYTGWICTRRVGREYERTNQVQHDKADQMGLLESLPQA